MQRWIRLRFQPFSPLLLWLLQPNRGPIGLSVKCHNGRGKDAILELDMYTHTVSFFVDSLRVPEIRLTHFQSAELEADVHYIFEAPNWAGHQRSSVFSGADCNDPEEPWGNWDRCSKSPEAFTTICTALRELPALRIFLWDWRRAVTSSTSIKILRLWYTVAAMEIFKCKHWLLEFCLRLWSAVVRIPLMKKAQSQLQPILVLHEEASIEARIVAGESFLLQYIVVCAWRRFLRAELLKLEVKHVCRQSRLSELFTASKTASARFGYGQIFACENSMRASLI
eukprot:s1255_g20.t5